MVEEIITKEYKCKHCELLGPDKPKMEEHESIPIVKFECVNSLIVNHKDKDMVAFYGGTSYHVYLEDKIDKDHIMWYRDEVFVNRKDLWKREITPTDLKLGLYGIHEGEGLYNMVNRLKRKGSYEELTEEDFERVTKELNDNFPDLFKDIGLRREVGNPIF